MAIYHLSVKTISRSKGRSATAAAAYRAGEKIIDERTGEIHDYQRRSGVENTEIFLPDNAPSWASDREQLWNQAEHAEKRKNSTVAREFELALPEELTKQERLELVREFAAELVERHGMAVDVALHEPGKGDERNHHAHVLCSTRRLGEEGFTEKTRELDVKTSGEVDHWRERWGVIANRHLEQAGHQVTIDHRSLEAQGIDRIPTVHIGPTAAAMERKGKTTERGDLNREIKQINAEVVKLDEARKTLEETLPTVQIGKDKDEDSKAFSQRRQNYKQRLLSKAYKTQISDKLGDRLSYVQRDSDVIDIRLRDGGRIIDRGDRLKATKANGNEISAIVELAEAKGWSTLNLTGTEEFRRSVWFEAVAKGLEVKGYEPSKADQFTLEQVIENQEHQVEKSCPGQLSEPEQVGETEQALPTDLKELQGMHATLSRKYNKQVRGKWDKRKQLVHEKIEHAADDIEQINEREPEAPGFWGRMKGEQDTYERHHKAWQNELEDAEKTLAEGRKELGNVETEAFRNSAREVKELIAEEAPELIAAIEAAHVQERQAREAQERDKPKEWSRYNQGREIER